MQTGSWLATLVCLCLGPGLAAQDCNSNGVSDEDDIAAGRSVDCNGNSIPDACEFAPVALQLGSGSVLVPATPHLMEKADLDGDGDTDIVQTGDDRQRSTVSTLLQLGGRQFTASSREVEGLITGFACGDLDADGALDLLTASRSTVDGSEFFLSLRNLGAGQLAAPVRSPVPFRMRSVALGDFDEDGQIDVAAALRGAAVAILRGRGDGTFVDLVETPTGNDPREIAAVDLDSSGSLDLVTLSRADSTFSVLSGDGLGGFSDPVGYAIGSPFASRLRVADVNRDGAPELLGLTLRVVSVVVNRGDGTFGEPSSFPVRSGLAFDVGDLDGDLAPELVVAQRDVVVIKRNDGAGGFAVADELRGLISRAEGVAIDDFDADGHTDLALLAASPASVQFLWRVDDVTPLEFRSITVPLVDPVCTPGLGCRPHAAAMGDVDGDGDRDALAFVPFPAALLPARNHEGRLIPEPGVVFDEGQPRSADVGDLDGDGDLDVAAVDHSTNALSLLENDGDGTFSPRGKAGTPLGPLRVRLADFDGDARLDAAVSGVHAGVLLNQGGFVFRRHVDQDLDVLRISGTSGITPVDADGDGSIDLAVGHGGATNVSILLNSGVGTFTDVFADYPLSARPDDLRAGDFDADGRTDVVAAGVRSTVSLLLNRGAGRFQPAPGFTSVSSPLSLIVEDLDGDGHLDVVAASEIESSITVLPGLGDGRFGQSVSFDGGAGLRFVRAGDLDLDGDVDLVTFDRPGLSLTVLDNETPRASEVPGAVDAICTAAEFHTLSQAAAPLPLERGLPFLVSTGERLPVPPVLFLNARRFAGADGFLTAEFPDAIGALTPKEFLDLTVTRETRSFYVGEIYRVRTEEGISYGFTLEGRWNDAAERPSVEEVRSLHELIGAHLAVRPFAYLPLAERARSEAEMWNEPGFPITFLERAGGVGYEPYTQGVTFGYVRLLDEEALVEVEARCAAGDIALLSGPPRALEVAVAAVITSEPQDPHALLGVRTNRRGAPNAYASDALVRLGAFRDRLVRLEVGPTAFTVREATMEEVEAFRASQQRDGTAVVPDGSVLSFANLEQVARLAMDADASVAAEARFGRATTRLSLVSEALGGMPPAAPVRGFAIPVSHFLDFLRSGRIGSAIDPLRTVTYAEYLDELRLLAAQADRTAYCEALRLLAGAIRTESEMPRELLRSVIERAGEVFAQGDVLFADGAGLRLLPSTNVDAPLAFSSRGLYPRPIVREQAALGSALRQIWAALFEPGAVLAREEAGLVNIEAAMSVFVAEEPAAVVASGVVVNGDPANPLDRNLLVRVQPGLGSVDGEEFGVRPATVRLSVQDGRVEEIVREEPSSLVPVGATVLDDATLLDVGRVALELAQRFPVDLGGRSPADALLEVDFRVDAAGEIVVTGVTPFLLHNPPPMARTFELEIPAGTVICGMFSEAGAARGLREEYELKTEVSLRAGVHALTTEPEQFETDLVEEVVFGPDREIGIPQEPGRFRVFRFDDATGATVYRFTYRQLFLVGIERELEVVLVSPLAFAVRDAEVESTRRVLDEEFFTTKVGSESLQALLDGEPLIRFGSCTHRLLERFEVAATLEDGTTLRLEERFREADTLFETGPASLQRAEVGIAGATQLVTDRFRLVYSATRHNAAPRYWVVLEPPVPLARFERPVAVVELAAPAPEFGQEAPEAFYLDGDLGVLAELQTTSYTRTAGETPREPEFLRGDVNADGQFDVSDAFTLLRFLFRDGEPPACGKAADANDDGRMNLLDAITIPGVLFGRRGVLPEPSGECGIDPTADTLGCAEDCRR